VAVDALRAQPAVQPEPVQPGLVDRDDARRFAGRVPRRLVTAAVSPAFRPWRDIFSLPGNRIVRTQFDWLSSNETSMALLSSRMAVAAGTASAVSDIGCFLSEWISNSS
jgi:hypothetical protein